MATLMSEAQHEHLHRRIRLQPRAPRRAVAFGGGGPAVGISVGFLLALEEWNQAVRDRGQADRTIEFPVWLAGCVGGWLTCLYHLGDSPKARNVEKTIREFFRPDDMYENYPSPTTFTPDIPDQIAAGLKFLVDPRNYENMVVPAQILRGYQDVLDYYLTPSRWNRGDFSFLMLNSVFAPNPAARLVMSLLYKTETPGLNKLWFGPDYSLLKSIDLGKLSDPGMPDIYINSYNIDRHRSDLYSNHPKHAPVRTQPLTMQALCASSALPYVLSPVKVDGDTHIEGALVDSFCFEAVQQHHQHINEVWISQIVDHCQVKAPTHLLDALNNLIMLYAGTTSRHDIEMFVNELNRHEYMKGLLDPEYTPDLIECFRLPVQSSTNYFWNHSNFDNSVRLSKQACHAFIRDYDRGREADGQRLPQRKNLFVRSTQFSGD